MSSRGRGMGRGGLPNLQLPPGFTMQPSGPVDQGQLDAFSGMISAYHAGTSSPKVVAPLPKRSDPPPVKATSKSDDEAHVDSSHDSDSSSNSNSSGTTSEVADSDVEVRTMTEAPQAKSVKSQAALAAQQLSLRVHSKALYQAPEYKPSVGAQGRQECMTLINDLRAIGAAQEVNLPTIVVIGNQSSGKSSLLEAISKIKFPRAMNTCTKVPTEVRMSRNDSKPWTCKVTLRRDGITETAFGGAISDPNMVEQTIRRAQLALLNPSVDAASFETYEVPAEPQEKPLGSTQQLAFSNDVVCLNIEGPDVTDLTVIDLPGIISSVGQNEDPMNIALVENMIMSYIKKECLILLCTTMRDDIRNQKAAMLAREVDKEGRRTIGVLTKPDTISGAEVSEWLPVFQNEKEQLRQGYFVTLQPSPDDLKAGISFDQARQKEETFFKSQQPWSDITLSLRNRMGTNKLAQHLSELLFVMIKKELPTIQKEITSIYDELETQIAKLPAEPPADPLREIHNIINAITGDLQSSTMGAAGAEKLVQALLSEYEQFRRDIWATAPRFTPFTATERTDALEAKKSWPSRKRDLAGEVDGLRESAELGAAGAAASCMNLDEVRAHVLLARSRELPGNVPFSAKGKMIQDFTVKWHAKAEALFLRCQPAIRSTVEHLVSTHFGQYEYGGLPQAARQIVESTLAKLFESTLTGVQWLLQLESQPYTQNAHYLSDYKTKIAAQLRDIRSKYLKTGSANPSPELLAELMALMTRAGFVGKTIEDLKKMHGTDEYDVELEVMAEVRAYFQVAYKRIIDYVPRAIDIDVVQKLAVAIRDPLTDGLVEASQEGKLRAKHLMRDDPTAAAQRESLLSRQRRLFNARRAIQAFAHA